MLSAAKTQLEVAGERRPRVADTVDCGGLHSGLTEEVKAIPRSEGQQDLARVFSQRHEFPTGWQRFLTAATPTLDFTLTPDRFPFQLRGRTIQIMSARVFVKF